MRGDRPLVPVARASRTDSPVTAGLNRMGQDMETIEHAGPFRVSLEVDDYAGQPEDNAGAYVFRIDGAIVELKSSPYGDTMGDHMAAVIAARLGQDGYDYASLVDMLTRRFCAVDVDVIGGRGWNDPNYLFVVTLEQTREWGLARDRRAGSSAGTVDEWRAWLEGDVYSVILEEQLERPTCAFATSRFAGTVLCVSCGAECE